MPQKNIIKLLYNPTAGTKRRYAGGKVLTLEEIKLCLKQYQLPVDYFPTKSSNHATQLAKDSIKEGYETVLVAGGDGTINEIANGLVGSNITLGIIPLGTFNNIAGMLSIPLDIEKAIEIIKIRRIRKIDVGMVTTLAGEKLSNPFYFLESSGIGFDAHIQKHVKKIEQGRMMHVFSLLNDLLKFTTERIEIKTDTQSLSIKTSLISIANGPFSGANLDIAPHAKLNDHMLNVVIYKMSKWELVRYFLMMRITKRKDLRRLKSIKTTEVEVSTKSHKIPVHADACLFGTTPVKYKIKPNALNVICGFPRSEEETALKARTVLDP